MKLFKIVLFGLLGFFVLFPGLNLKAATTSQTNQYYTVTFDKEQEATVVAKLTYTNVTKSDIKDLKLEIPGTSLRVISVLQEQRVATKACASYDYNTPVDEATGMRKCLRYSDQTNSYTNTYALLDFDAPTATSGGSSSALTITLKQAIASGQTGTVILNYKAKGMASPVWNGYKYNFQTIKSPYDVDNVRVAINVTDDLYIKETAQGQTNYVADISSAMPMLSSSAFTESAPISKISSSIQESQGVVKQTTSLDPNENYKVEGKYYNNNFMGELPTIVGVGITFLIIIFVLVIIIKNEKK